MWGPLVRRITISYIGIVLLTTTGIGFYATEVLRQAQLDRMRDVLAAEGRLLSDSVTPALIGDDLVAIQSFTQHVAGSIDARVTVINPAGLVLSDSARAPADIGSVRELPEVRTALTRQVTGSALRVDDSTGREMLFVTSPVMSRAQLVGVVRVGADATPALLEVQKAVTTIVAAIVVAILMISLLARMVERRIAHPLRRLAILARALAEGQRRPYVNTNGNDEVGELARAFDDMDHRLRERIASLETDRDHLNTVLAAMGDGVVLVDHADQVVLANPAAASMLGTPLSEMARTFDRPSRHSLIEITRDHEVHAVARQALAGARVRTALVRLTHSGKHVRLTATPIQGESTNLLLLLQDITELQRTEHIRRDFVANVSHELKTPIASIKALTETLEEGALDDTEAAREFLKLMHIEVDKLAQIVQELLELSRIESGHTRMEFGVFGVEDLMTSAVNRLRTQAERARVTLEVKHTAGVPPVLADGPKVEGAIINLIHNAIKFTPPGGQIQLVSENTTFDGRASARFSVIDTGIGIASEDVSRLFERFYKADKSRASSGTGLGLAIVKHVVLAHGGRIGATSVLGKGSTFWFTLPLAPAGANVEEAI